MRVTNSIVYRQSLGNITRSYARLAQAQNIAGSQQAIFKPSDNPQGTAKAIRNRSVLNTIDQHLKNVDDAREWLDTADLTLGQASNILVRLKELVQGGVNGTRSDSDRQAASAEAKELYDELVQLANTQIDGRYIFSGDSPVTKPFQEGADGVLRYVGNKTETNVEVDSGLVSIGVSGDEIFSWNTGSVTRNEVAVSGDKIQLNNSFLFQPVRITVGSTTYQPSDYTFDPATGAITLPDTYPTDTTATVSYDMDVLQVAKAIQRGLSDTGHVTRSVSSDLDGNIQIPVQSMNGSIKVIDSTGTEVTGFTINKDGDPWVVGNLVPPGSAFTVTYSDPSQVTDTLAFLQDMIGMVDQGSQHVTNIRTTLGSRSSRLDSVQERLESRSLSVVDAISKIEDADFAEAATKLAEMEIQYQSALAAAAKSSRMSLLDYLK